MSLTHNLSNDAILGLDVDLPINENYDYSGTNEGLSIEDSQQGQPQTSKPKRRTDKLTPDLLTSNQGIFKILKRAKQFKFDKRAKSQHNYNLSYKNVRYSNSVKYGEDHHYKNLTKVLQMYQSWGHDLRSHMKFDRFINTIFKGFEDPYMKEWLRNQTREEMRAKMEKETLKEQEKIAKANAMARGNDDSFGSVPSQAADVNMDEIYAEANRAENNDHEEEWSELFGGNKNGTSNANDNNNNEDIDISQIREKSHFSNYLRTSSQPAPFSSSQGGSADDADKEEINDEFDEIEGLQSILDDEENDKATNESQPNTFSQYIAVGSQGITSDSIPEMQNESFADDTSIMLSQSDVRDPKEVHISDVHDEFQNTGAVTGPSSKDSDDDNFSDEDDIDALLVTL